MNIARNSSAYFVNDIEWWWGGQKSRLPKGPKGAFMYSREQK